MLSDDSPNMKTAMPSAAKPHPRMTTRRAKASMRWFTSCSDELPSPTNGSHGTPTAAVWQLRNLDRGSGKRVGGTLQRPDMAPISDGRLSSSVAPSQMPSDMLVLSFMPEKRS